MTASEHKGQLTVLPWEQVSNKRGTHRGQDTQDMVRKTRTPNRHNTGKGKHSEWGAAKLAGDGAVSQSPRRAHARCSMCSAVCRGRDAMWTRDGVRAPMRMEKSAAGFMRTCTSTWTMAGTG